MKRLLQLADGLRLPLDVVTETLLILGKRNTGKSNTGVRLAEQMIRHKLTIGALDPVDVWWGLKAGADGKARGGLEVYVFGGDHQDFPLEPTSGTLMADLLIHERINVVIVLRQFSNREKALFVAAFADRLFRRNKDPLHLFCEEAHEFMPQRPQKGEEVMLGRMLRLQKSGRTCGIGLSSITQRPPELSKTATTQAEILIQHRVKGAQDVEAFLRWVRHNQEEERVAEVLKSLASLKVGEGWWWSPGWPANKPLDLLRVLFPLADTFDSRQTPKPGVRRRAPKSLAPIDRARISQQMAETIERHEAEDPRVLKVKLAEKDRELAKLRATPLVVPKEKVREVKVPVLKDGQISRLEKAVRRLDNSLQEYSGKIGTHVDTLKGLSDFLSSSATSHLTSVQTVVNEVLEGIQKAQQPMAPVADLARVRRRKEREETVVLPERRPGPRGRNREQAKTLDKSNSEVKLFAGERRILAVLGEVHPLRRTRAQLGTLADLTPKGGTFQTYWRKLKRHGFVGEDGAEVFITDDGMDYLGADAPTWPADPKARLEVWMSKLFKGEREMLEVMFEWHPKTISPMELAMTVGKAVGGGTFQTYLRSLLRNGLLEKMDNGSLRAGKVLFD